MKAAPSQFVVPQTTVPSAALGGSGERTLAGQRVKVHPLSYNQLSMWYLYQMTPESDAYNIWFTGRIRSVINVVALRHAFQTLIDRHAILRTTYTLHQGEPVQQIHDEQSVDFAQIDASAWGVDELKQQVALIARQPFDLERGPLMRVRLFACTPTDHVLLINNHHIAADIPTYMLMLKELGELYPAAINGTHFAQQLNIGPQYSKYVDWQRTMLAGEQGEQSREYWQQQLAGELPVLDLPMDRPMPPVLGHQGASVHLQINSELYRRLRTLAEVEGASIFSLLLAAYHVLLYRYTQQEEILIGTVVGTRDQRQFETVAGYFVNPIIIRARTPDNLSFRTLLHQMHHTAQDSLQHRHYPLMLLVEQLQRQRHPSRPLPYQVAFHLIGPRSHGGWAAFFGPEDKPTPIELGGLNLEPFYIPGQEANVFLLLTLYESAETLQGFFKYNTALFDAPTIQRMVGHLQTLLAAIVANPDQPIVELPLLTDSEHRQLLVEWNNTAAPFSHDQCFPHMFEAQVERIPDAIAVVYPASSPQSRVQNLASTASTSDSGLGTASHTLTYRELNMRANQLAHHLQTLGVSAETLIGLCVERSPEMIIGILGILKAGGAYVPLDPAYPQERLTFMLEDAQPEVVITQSHILATLPCLAPSSATCPPPRSMRSVICLDTDWSILSYESSENPSSHIAPDNLAYVIYTSGSTGQPKGVLVTHRGLCNYVNSSRQVFRIGPNERLLQHFSFSFDAATAEIAMALGVGASLYLRPPEHQLPAVNFLPWLHEMKINMIANAPSMLAALPTVDLPDLHTIAVGGEACPADLVARWGRGRRFFNGYGPTEATIAATVAECKDDGKRPHIGRPGINAQIYILDHKCQPVPIGVRGELYIGGVGVARGYLNHPELTAERFIPNLFGDGRLYRTGDLARYLSDGNIEFLGRIDNQVKVNGFRIELGEIEHVLMEHPQVRECAVVIREDCPSDKQLVAYIVGKAENDGGGQSYTNTGARAHCHLRSATLRAHLQTKLPHYMVPSAFVQLEALPLTPNSKLDHRALPAPSYERSPEVDIEAFQSPTEEQLASIWITILGVDQVNRHDNFFDLGGHSLRAIALLHEVQEVLAVTVSVRQLYEAPTIAAMAHVIDEMRMSVPCTTTATTPLRARSLPTCLIPLQTEGMQPPFFCIHPVAGVVFPYYDLAIALGENQPIYGLQAVGLAAGERPLTSVVAMAEHYLTAIRIVQPHGPYLLGGWSFGVHVAYEMAQLLHQAGEHVALLALIDTAPVTVIRLRDLIRFAFASVLPSIWPYVLEYVQLLARRLPTLPGRADNQPIGQAPFLRAWLARVNGLMALWAAGRQLPETWRVLRVMWANMQALSAYSPQPYPDRLILLRTSQAYGASRRNSDLGWQALAQGGVEVYTVPGHHLNLLRKPYVHVLADQLRQCTRTAISRSETKDT